MQSNLDSAISDASPLALLPKDRGERGILCWYFVEIYGDLSPDAGNPHPHHRWECVD